MLQITYVNDNGVQTGLIAKEKLEVTAQDDLLTLKDRSTGSVILQLKPNEFFKIDEITLNA